MRCCRDPSGSIDLDAFVSRAGRGRLAGVQAHPNSDGRALGPVVRGQFPLALDGGGVLEDAASAVSIAGRPAASLNPPDGHPPFPTRPGCAPTRTFDASTFVYTLTSDCSRTSGRVSASFQRERIAAHDTTEARAGGLAEGKRAHAPQW